MHRTFVFILSVLVGFMLSSGASAQDCASCPKMKSEKSSSVSSAKSRTYAGLQGKLRLAHLQAHLSTRSQLTPAQIAKYDELRGYSGQSPKKMDHEKMHQMKM